MEGICKLSWIPLRAKPESSSEMVSSILFGETYKVINQQGDWIEVLTNFDQYKGFISADQYSINQFTSDTPTLVVNNVFITPKSTNLPLIISGGSVLHAEEVKLLPSQLIHPNENVFLSEKLKETALKFLGVPYLWGGRCFAGIDCSGFTQIIYKINGIAIPRDSRQQNGYCKSIPFEEIKQGDLLFFGKTKEKITHVGIYLDNKKVIHSSGFVRIDNFDNEGIYREDGKRTHIFISAGKV